MPFPAPPHYFPTKDEMADYLERYAGRFQLPVRTGTRIQRLARAEGGGFVAVSNGRRYRAENVVVAMANYQEPRVPDLADELDPDIVQLHSADYRNPSRLRDGPVLLVGAGNSGSEIAMELASRHEVWMSGREVGNLPFRIAGRIGRTLMVPLVLRVLFHRVFTRWTPIGRALRPKVVGKGGPLIRVMPRDLDDAGVKRVPKTRGVQGGLPVLDDGRVLEVANVVWCTGYHTGFESWIDLPVHDGGHEPRHQGGTVPGQPGLYFLGLHFLRAMSSAMIHGVGRDADHIAGLITERSRRGAAEEIGTAPAPGEVAAGGVADGS
jgi:putative flavoprotein involved in K+ transport